MSCCSMLMCCIDVYIRQTYQIAGCNLAQLPHPVATVTSNHRMSFKSISVLQCLFGASTSQVGWSAAPKLHQLRCAVGEVTLDGGGKSV